MTAVRSLTETEATRIVAAMVAEELAYCIVGDQGQPPTFLARDAPKIRRAQRSLMAALNSLAGVRACWWCGCTDEAACVNDIGRRCSWLTTPRARRQRCSGCRRER